MRSRQPPTARRAAVTALETVVALGLVSVGVSIATTIAVRNHHLLADNRAYRVAVDELSNRLDVLVTMPGEAAAAAVDALPDTELPAPLVGAKLAGAIEDEAVGRRITLSLVWGGAVQRRPEVVLSAWSFVGSDSQEGQP